MFTTIRIAEDEAFPDYILDAGDHADVELDVPEEVAARWRATRAAWDQAADEIRTAYRSVRHEIPPAEGPGPSRYGAVYPPPYPGRILR